MRGVSAEAETVALQISCISVVDHHAIEAILGWVSKRPYKIQKGFPNSIP